MTDKHNPHDLVEHAQWEIKHFDMISRNTAKQLLAEVIRLRDLMEDAMKEQKFYDK